jgi:hypothetical protein
MTAMADRTATSITVVGLGGSMAVPSRSLAALKLGLVNRRRGLVAVQITGMRKMRLE